MSILKKQGAGFYLGALALVLGAVGTVYYNINCHTSYFSNLGTNPVVLGSAVAALVLLLVVLVGSQLAKENPLLDVCHVAAPVLLMVAFANFATSRVNGIASIMTFENNAQTMADLNSALVGLVLLLLATVAGILAAFFAVRKEG